MQGVGGDVAGQPTSQFIGEEHICEFGLSICAPFGVALVVLQVLEMDLARNVGR